MTGIRYAQCWEDPRVLRQALIVSCNDDIISIASGGDNTFALLLDDPRSVTAVDYNRTQLFLAELKICAVTQLDYDDFIRFVGVRPCSDRPQLYKYIRISLTEPARGYWDRQQDAVARGIIHSGKFERYFAVFRRIVLPLIHRREIVRELSACSSLQEQEAFYRHTWDNRRWRAIFKIFFGRLLLGRLGRDQALLEQVVQNNVGEILLHRARHGLTEIPVGDNFFLEYILTGGYADLTAAHPYLHPGNYHILRERLPRLRLVHAELAAHLRNMPPRTISKFNFSDIFEYMTPAERESTWREILRVARPEARMAFWTLFVPQAIPAALSTRLSAEADRGPTGTMMDRCFFYHSFHLWKTPVENVPDGFSAEQSFSSPGNRDNRVNVPAE